MRNMQAENAFDRKGHLDGQSTAGRRTVVLRGHSLDILFVLALFALFAISSLLLVLFGARVYKQISGDMSDNNALATSISYVVNKVRASDTAGMVSVGEFDGCPAVLLEQDIEGTIYQTAIYYYDGSLRELFARKELEFKAKDGAEVVKVADFSIKDTGNGVIQLAASNGAGREQDMLLCVRSGK